LKESAMILDYALSGIVTVLLTVYLIYALVRPERF
jgi:K+-transporting ATPase KdpF subunit